MPSSSPGTGRIGAAEGALHGGAQRDRVDALAALKLRQKETRGIGEDIGYIGFRATGRQSSGASASREERKRSS